MASRGILQDMEYVQTLTDIDDAEAMGKLLEKQKSRFAGRELQGKTLGVIGLGAIGSLVAEMALSLDMNVVGFDPALSEDAAWRLPSQVQRMENQQSLMARSDYITVHVPAIEPTRHMINSESLKGVKTGAVLLNFARQSIVDAQAVVGRLDQWHFGRYICDFPVFCLSSRPYVYAMRHIAASTQDAEESCPVMVSAHLME